MDQATAGISEGTSALRFGIECGIPYIIHIGKGNAIYLHGWCYHPKYRISRLEIVAGNLNRPVDVFGTVRFDIFSSHHPRHDPKGHSFRSGFWGLLPLPESSATGSVDVQLRATLFSGEVCATTVASRILLAGLEATSIAFSPGVTERPLVAICMATCNPPLELFERQIASIVNQSHTNWVCIISDDRSRPETYAEIRAITREDSRFVVTQSPERLGFYRNFEHCLSMVPLEAAFVALSDHDDEWHPDKLSSLLAAFGPDTSLAYSDTRIVNAEGRVLSETYWTTRRNNYNDLTSLLIANTVTGAASLFRRKLLELALPFPELPGEPYHDHWLACVALASGSIAYVDRPLYDYVQHARNVIGHHAPAHSSFLRNTLTALQSPAAFSYTVALWKNIYFGDVLRIEIIATILQLRCRNLLDRRKTRVLRRLGRLDVGLFQALVLAARRVRELWRGNETLAAETRLLRGVLWKYSSILRSRIGPGPRITRRGTEVSGDAAESYAKSILKPVVVIRQKIAPLQLVVDPDTPRRVNLLIPTIDFDYVFGGYLAKFCLAQKLSDLRYRVRLVIVDYCDYRPALWKQQLRAFQDLGALLDSCELTYAFDRDTPLPVSPQDSFIATTWWTAYIARDAARTLGREEFLYMIQEYEPFTFPMGTFASLARESYGWPHRAVFSTAFLQEYFSRQRLGVFAAAVREPESWAASFDNAITDIGNVSLSDIRGSRARKLLFYARPEAHAARNMFELGILALCAAIDAGAFDGNWEFTGIGSVGPSCTIPLSKGRHMRLLQRQTQSEYKRVLLTHDLGMSLMYTPHPSLVPIEMASAAMIVVTNTFENKTAESLRRISSNLVAVSPTVQDVAEALRAAVLQVEDFDGRIAGAAVNWPKDWNSSFNEDVLKRITRLLKETTA